MADEPYFIAPSRTGYANPGGGNVAAGGVSRGPQCAEGYAPGPGGQGCVRTMQGQTQDLALQNLKNQVSGAAPKAAAVAAPAAAPLSPASAYRSSSTGSTSTTTTTSGGGGGNADRIARPDFQPGNDANLLRAKDRQGQIARSALTGLRGALGERGMLGSGAETGGTEDIAAKGLQSLTDVNREGLIQDDAARHDYDLAGYQGDISQRATDIGRSNALDALATQARGQDIGANVAYRGQDVTARGQDIAGQSAAGQLQLQQQNVILAALKAASLY